MTTKILEASCTTAYDPHHHYKVSMKLIQQLRRSCPDKLNLCIMTWLLWHPKNNKGHLHIYSWSQTLLPSFIEIGSGVKELSGQMFLFCVFFPEDRGGIKKYSKSYTLNKVKGRTDSKNVKLE